VEDFRAIGYDGIINFPSAASNPTRAEMRAHLGLGLRREAEMMTLAGKAGLLTMAYAWTIEQAQLMTDAGVDILVAHAGWTVGGSAGRDAESISVAASVEHVQRVIEATWAINPDCICLAHGGALAEPADTEYLYRTTDAQGFVGASSIERIPIERAVQQTVEAFKSARLR
jgi:predicted TIM-barrel enzyme